MIEIIDQAKTPVVSLDQASTKLDIAIGANGTSTKLSREDSDGGTHIWHQHHIASIEPVCTSTDDDGDDNVDDEDHDDDDDDDDLHDFMCRKPM
ncbi:MAG: hypothetical protein OIF58_00190 [Cohaesibacter sp.]|nr:hypothetical protein [Cohaesibacter sp.]